MIKVSIRCVYLGMRLESFGGGNVFEGYAFVDVQDFDIDLKVVKKTKPENLFVGLNIKCATLNSHLIENRWREMRKVFFAVMLMVLPLIQVIKFSHCLDCLVVFCVLFPLDI